MENAIDYRLEDLILYSEQQIKNLAHEQIWAGKGTETNPFVIQNANILGQTFLIKRSTLYISFVNCNFDYILLEACQNISLINCSFMKLSIKRCSKFKIESCFVSDLNLLKVKEIYFKNSVIINISSKLRIKAILFEDCQMNDAFLDSIERKKYDRQYKIKQIKEGIPSYILIFSAFVFYRLFYTYYILKSSDFINMLLIITLMFTIGVFFWILLYEYLLKNKPPKIIILKK